jgi:hypothetical protein
LENIKNGEDIVDGAEVDFLFFCYKFGGNKRGFEHCRFRKFFKNAINGLIWLKFKMSEFFMMDVNQFSPVLVSMNSTANSNQQ